MNTSIASKALLKCLSLMIFLWASNLSFAQVGSFEEELLDLDTLTNAEFLPVKEAYQPEAWIDGEDLVIEWKIADEYYLYRDRTFFSSPEVTHLDAVYEEGLLIEDEFFKKEMVVYRGSTQMRLPGVSGDGFLTIEAQGCADAGLCYPPTDFWLEVNSTRGNVVYYPQKPEQMNASIAGGQGAAAVAGATDSFLIAIAMAFFGGLILNLMPCVFPVLAIKALKISSVSESFSERAKEAGAYTAGILTTVLIIAGALIALRAGGAQVGWGFQLQSPVMVLALTVLFFLIGLSFSGWIEFGARFAGVGQSLTEEGKPMKSFFTGVLAMVVASPCSAPFMAAALGYAINQPAAVSLLVFSSLGIGMAFPLILLYMVPAVADKMPRPGPWMETFKQFLAFPMYLTCVWLVWVLITQLGGTGAALVLAALCLFAMAIWIINRSSKTFGKASSLATAAGAFFLCFMALQQATAKPPTTSADFELATLDNAVGGSNPVFLDVTADWCITCKFNETGVLYTSEIIELFEENNVEIIVADWTNENPEITKLLDRYQRVGIPLYLYFPAGETTPEILPQILTKEMMRELFI